MDYVYVSAFCMIEYGFIECQCNLLVNPWIFLVADDLDAWNMY